MKLFIEGYGETEIKDYPHPEYNERFNQFYMHPGYDVKVCKCGRPFWVEIDSEYETCGRPQCEEGNAKKKKPNQPT